MIFNSMVWANADAANNVAPAMKKLRQMALAINDMASS
jgi:hypothetical protein